MSCQDWPPLVATDPEDIKIVAPQYRKYIQKSWQPIACLTGSHFHKEPFQKRLEKDLPVLDNPFLGNKVQHHYGRRAQSGHQGQR